MHYDRPRTSAGAAQRRARQSVLIAAALIATTIVISACQATSAGPGRSADRSAADAAWSQRLQGQADALASAAARARGDAAWTQRLQAQADASADALDRGMDAYRARLNGLAAASAAAAATPVPGE